MQLHDLKPNAARQTKKRVGRGGKRGKTSGRGHKGQAARAGNSTRPEMREIIKKIPKLRGHGINRAQTVNAEKILHTVINVSVLESGLEAGAAVNPKALVAAGLIRTRRKKAPTVKILGTGDISKKFIVTSCEVSASAKEKIEKVGGTVT